SSSAAQWTPARPTVSRCTSPPPSTAGTGGCRAMTAPWWRLPAMVVRRLAVRLWPRSSAEWSVPGCSPAACCGSGDVEPDLPDPYPSPPTHRLTPARVHLWSFETGFRDHNRTLAGSGRCSVPRVAPEPGLLLVQQRLRLGQHPRAAGADRACVDRKST